MSIRSIKFQAAEGAPYNVNNNIINLQIPSSVGFSDLDSSYIEFEVVLQNDDLTAVYFNKIETKYDNTVLVRNCRLESSTLGLLEEIQEINLLDANLHPHMLNYEQKKKEDAFSMKSDPNTGENQFFTPSASGTSLATNNAVGIQIPLKRLFPGLDGMRQYPNAMYGDLKIHLELDDFLGKNYLIPKCQDNAYYYYRFADPAGGADAASITTVGTYDSQTFSVQVGDSPTINYTAGGTDFAVTPSVTNVAFNAGGTVTLTLDPALDRNGGSITNVYINNGLGFVNPTAGANASTLTTTNNKTAADLKLWVGEAVDFEFLAGAGNTAHYARATITQIAYAGGKAVVTFTPALDRDGGNITNVFLGQVRSAVTMLLNKCDVVVKQLFLSEKQIKRFQEVAKSMTLPYKTFKLEKVYMPSTSSYSRQFDMPPGCFNSFLLMPDPTAKVENQLSDALISKVTNVNSYRFSVDGIDTNNRDVVVNGSLHYDKLIETFSNMRKPLLSVFGLTTDYTATSDSNKNNGMLLAQIIPVKQVNQTMMANIYGNAMAARNVYVYKQVLKGIKSEKGSVMVI